jgi:hypothetical protein
MCSWRCAHLAARTENPQDAACNLAPARILRSDQARENDYFVPLAGGLVCLRPLRGAEARFSVSFSVDEFPNGLRLVTVPTDNPDLVALAMVVRTGARNESNRARASAPTLSTDVSRERTIHPEQRDAILKQAGASVNAYTSDDRTVYHTLFSKEDLDKVMELEADRFQRLRYSADVCRPKRAQSLAV